MRSYAHPALCVGWLDDQHPIVTGPPSVELITRLWGFAAYQVLPYFGVEACPLCGTAISREIEPGRWLNLGSAEIRIFHDGSIFACPNLIPHFVEAHHYASPDEFVRAVLDGPAPFSAEYEGVLTRYLEDERWQPTTASYSSKPWEVVRQARGWQEISDGEHDE